MTGAGTRVNWERIAAATGIVFFTSILLTFLIPTEVPASDAPVAEIRDWYGTAQTGYLWMQTILVLGAGALIWFSGSVRSAIVRVEADGRLASLAFAGGVLTGAIWLMAYAIQTQGFMTEGAILNLDDSALTGVYAAESTISSAIFGLTTITRAVMLTAAATAAFRLSAFPRWLGWASAVVAAISWLGTLIILSGTPGSMTGLAWIVALFLFPLWVLAASIHLMRAPAPS